jgi:hypothetical protein
MLLETGIMPPVEQPPDFLTSPLKITEEDTFKPALIPRRGGIIAWCATLLVAIVAILTMIRSGQIPCLTTAMFLFFLLAAILITFSYWVDSRTFIQVTQTHLTYRSPFRRFLQNWKQISEINTLKAGQTWRVLVIGEQSSFSIRIGEKSSVELKPTRVLELPRGDILVREICGMANLSKIERNDDIWVCKKSS